MHVQAKATNKDFTSAGSKGISMPTYHVVYTYIIDGLPDVLIKDERVDETTYRMVAENAPIDILVNPTHYKRAIIVGNTVYKEHLLKAMALDVVLIIAIVVLMRIHRKSKKEEILVLGHDQIHTNAVEYLQSHASLSCVTAHIYIDAHYYVEDWGTVFHELFRILKPNSVVLLACWLEERTLPTTDVDIDQQEKIASLLQKRNKSLHIVEEQMRNSFLKNGFDIQYAHTQHYQTSYCIVPYAQQNGFVLEHSPAWESCVDTDKSLIKRFTVIRLWKL